jgi:predicted RNA binding protein YcfA (HicA-like mRNA interferase family)
MTKTHDLKAHLKQHGCSLLREGANHEVWQGPGGERSTVPRHREIPPTTAREICKQLGVPKI